MRGFVASSILAAIVGCSSSSPAPAPSTLYENWAYTSSDGRTGLGITFSKDGTYEITGLALTSDTSADGQVEAGTFTTSGSTISLTPAKWSCEEPTYAPYEATYKIAGQTLNIVLKSDAFAMQVNSSPAATNFNLTIGCFTATGFIRSPLSSVGSCAGAGASCASKACCNGATCITANGGTCAAQCVTGNDCKTGCCHQLSGGNGAQGVCGPCDDAGVSP